MIDWSAVLDFAIENLGGFGIRLFALALLYHGTRALSSTPPTFWTYAKSAFFVLALTGYVYAQRDVTIRDEEGFDIASLLRIHGKRRRNVPPLSCWLQA